MELLISILATIPISYAINFVSFSDLVKKAADNGYLPNVNSFKNNNSNDEESKIEKYKKYIPVVCLIDALSNSLDLLFNEQEHFEEYRIHGYFDRMTKEEEEYYNKKKSIWSIYNLANKRRLEYEEEDKRCLKSNIKYLDNTLDDHEIVLKEEETEKNIDLDNYLNNLSKEQLEELKRDITIIKEWDKFFEDDIKGDYTINDNKGKKLIYRFNCKENDKK